MTTTTVAGAARSIDARSSVMARSLPTSEILRISGEIRAMPGGGKDVCNLTVGDFNPAFFPIPGKMKEETLEALRRGETNYPPAEGMVELRKAVMAYYEEWLGLKYDLGSVLITAGSRPGIHATYSAIVDPGDAVVYPVPSWNNTYYVTMMSAAGTPAICRKEDGFLPTRAVLEPLIRDARLLVLNSPSNPTGTAFTRETLEGICDLVLEENERRGEDERPLFLLYDHVYWMLTFHDTQHVNPVSLRPEMKPYTVFIDGISKAFAATGMRVGWVVGPSDLVAKMGSILGHVGAWAPRAEQLATSRVLPETAHLKEFTARMRRDLLARLDALHNGISKMRADGLPVDSIAPMGAMYLSAQFNLVGRRARDGRTLENNEDIRSYLLREANFGVIPFQAFGSDEDTGWCRLSAGAVSVETINQTLPQVRKALEALA